MSASAAPYRVGLFVGENHGTTGDQDLIFARSDARKMRDLFIDHGELRPEDAILLEDENKKMVLRQLHLLTDKIRVASERGESTMLLFYYSGHGGEDALHLGTSLLTHSELRAALEETAADVRIAMLDACQSGAAIRAKGGQRGPSFAFSVQAQTTRGTAFLTSSAASELSQESAEVGGGFFTHYLHSALLGAGDLNRDGEVTLTEAKSYVYGETVFGTRDSARTQTPSFDFDLTGQGNIALTHLEDASSKLNFLGDLGGDYSVWDESRKRYVAQVNGVQPTRLAVRPGVYYVHKRMPGWVDEAEYVVRRGETRTVVQEDFVSVPYEDTAARGDLNRVVRRAKLPRLSLTALFGFRSFGDTVFEHQYVPGHGLIGLEARFHRPTAITFWSVDFLAGGGSGVLTFSQLGRVPVVIQSYTLGATLGVVSVPALVRVGFGGRAELLSLSRTFVHDEAPTQTSFSIAPGIQGWIGLHPGRFQFEFHNNLQLMAIGFSSENKHPLYAEFFLSFGYRF